MSVQLFLLQFVGFLTFMVSLLLYWFFQLNFWTIWAKKKENAVKDGVSVALTVLSSAVVLTIGCECLYGNFSSKVWGCILTIFLFGLFQYLCYPKIWKKQRKNKLFRFNWLIYLLFAISVTCTYLATNP